MTTAEPPAGVRIRRVDPGDIDAIRRIERVAFPQPWPAKAFKRFIDEPGFLVATAEPTDDEPPTIVGYVVADIVTSADTKLGHVKDIAVAPEYRRRGVATVLLTRALGVLADHDVPTAKLEVREGNHAARSLYDRFGFSLRRRLPQYYADGEDALVFVAHLGEGTDAVVGNGT